MPLSLRSSSFCFLACLCSSGWVAAQTINQTNLTPPLYDIGEAFTLPLIVSSKMSMEQSSLHLS
ncbi:polymorphic outer membrane protein [Chlamydia psittaci Mat116]|nr:polymorphic outer membrane protein [Chlamydia psittaci Mat116]